jgi:hypothetical protein
MKTKNIRITYKYIKYKFIIRLICEFATYMYKKKQQQKNNYFADISAVQILKCINALVVFIDYIKR